MSAVPLELQLVRVPGDRRLYALDGVGTLRLTGLTARTALAEAADRRWAFAGRGFWRREVEARDEAGAVVGEFEPRTVRRGGTVRWNGRELALRPSSSWRERYALASGDQELLVLEGKSWGRRPVRLTVLEPGEVDPGLLLFAAFVVRRLAEDAATAAGGGSVAATTAAMG
jgi:hypothetical protein